MEMRIKEIQNQLDEIVKDYNSFKDEVQVFISSATDTQELSYGMNGYPEPYAGIGVRFDIEDIDDVEDWVNSRESQISEIKLAINDLSDDYDLSDEIIEILDELENELDAVEIGYCSIEIKPGQTFGYPYNQDKILTIENREQFYDFSIENSKEALKFLEENSCNSYPTELVNQFKEIAEELDCELCDLSKKYELKLFDLPDLEDCLYFAVPHEEDGNCNFIDDLEIIEFSEKKELEIFIDEKVFNQDFAVHIEGFTADLQDRLVASGGITTVKEPVLLNTPTRYQYR